MQPHTRFESTAPQIQNKKNWQKGVTQAITPGRGRAVSPKNKDNLKYMATKLQASECVGLVPMHQMHDPKLSKKEQLRRRCALCKVLTPWFCAGCKRWLCMSVDRSKTLQENNENGKAGLDLSKSILKLSQGKIDLKSGGETSETIFGIKSCYHIAHEQMHDQIMAVQSALPTAFLHIVDPEAADVQKAYYELVKDVKRK